jgi:Putative Ig domain
MPNAPEVQITPNDLKDPGLYRLNLRLDQTNTVATTALNAAQEAQQTAAAAAGSSSLSLSLSGGSGTVGESFTGALDAAGGTSPYSFGSTGLPPGLILNSSSGAITGTPTAVGTYTVSGTVTDADGNSASTSGTIVIGLPVPPNVTAATVVVSYIENGYAPQSVVFSGVITLPTSSPLYSYLDHVVIIATDPNGNAFPVQTIFSTAFSGSSQPYNNTNSAVINQPTVLQDWVVQVFSFNSSGGVAAGGPVTATPDPAVVNPASLTSIPFLEVGPRTADQNASVSSTFAVVPVVANSQYPMWVTLRIDYDDGRGPQQLGQFNLQVAAQAPSSSVTIAIGSQTFTVASGLGYTAGVALLISGSGGTWMYGTVTSYSGTSLVVNVLAAYGSGTMGSPSVAQAISWSAFAPTSASQVSWVATACTGNIADNVALPTGYLTQNLTVAAVGAPLPSDVINAQFVPNAQGQDVLYATNSLGQQTWWYNEIDWTQPTSAYDINYWFSNITTQKGVAQTGSGTVSGGNTLTTSGAAFLQFAGNATVQSGGTGYQLGDTLTLTSGTSTTSASYVVTGLSGSAVSSVSLLYPGTYTAPPSNPVSTSGGHGSGCTLNVSSWGNQAGVNAGTYYYLTAAAVSAGGNSYSVGDILIVSGGSSLLIAVLVVTSVSAGAVTGVAVGQPGTFAVQPTNPASTTTSGQGSGCTLTLTWGTSTSGPGFDIHVQGVLTHVTSFVSSTQITFAPVPSITNGAASFEIFNPAPDWEGANTGLAFGYLGNQVSDSGSLSGGITVPGSTVALLGQRADAWLMPAAHNYDGSTYLYTTWRFRIYAGSRLMYNQAGGTLVLQTTCWSGNDHQDVTPTNVTQPLDLMQSNPNTYAPRLGVNAGGEFDFLGIPGLGSLPTLTGGNPFYPIGSIVQLTTTGVFYQNVANVWESTQDPTKALPGTFASGVYINAAYILAGTLVSGVTYTGQLNVGQINNGNMTSSQWIAVDNASSQVVAALGQLSGALPGTPSTDYGIWAENAWFGGTGPTSALISLLGTSGAITGCTLVLVNNGLTTTINNATRGTSKQGLVVDDGTYYSGVSSINLGVYSDTLGDLVTLNGGSTQGSITITNTSASSSLTLQSSFTTSSPSASGSLSIPTVARAFLQVNADIPGLGISNYYIPLI